MSKSPNIFLPAIGITSLVLASAYGFSQRNYAEDRLETLSVRIDQMEASAAALRATSQQASARVAELETALADAQSAAAERAAMGSDLTAPVPLTEGTFGLGRNAHSDEIAAWDVDVLPDGRGLPVGSGDAYDGEEIFAEKCASCHGDFAEGVDNWPVLAGGLDTLADEDPVKTVGSYWPHLSTAWDYISRSMPFGEAGTLTADETYAIVAYILYSSDLIDDDFVLSNENLADFEMYNADGFVIDDRPELEYSQWRTEPCMTNCKDSVEITARAVFLDVTPDGGGDSVMNHASTDEMPTFGASSDNGGGDEETASSTALDSELVAAGEKVFKKCSACHAVGEGARNKSGPQLNALMGRPFASAEGFRYSNIFQTAASEGRVWDAKSLTAFLADPRGYMPGTKMSFSGLRKEGDQEAIVAYLSSFLGE